MKTVIFDLDHTLFAADEALYDGAQDLLAILRRLGVQVAGLSNHDHRILVRLEEAGVRSYFAHILCADQIADDHIEPKAAAGVRHVLKHLGARAEDTVLVSHAHSDILLGKDARLARTIGVTHGTDSAAPLREAGADHIVDNMPGVLDVIG
ncbi:MAG TPA: HAD family hydrolase [Bacillota bacterium]|nr:HAD family hydrolase [Bacillota bacterium]